MGKNTTQMPFYDYIDWINNANSQFTNLGNTYPNEAMRKVDAERKKQLIYNNVYTRLLNIILKLFKWNVPETIDARILEFGFVSRGYVCIFRGPEGIFGLPCIPSNMYNIYGNPTVVQVFGFNGYQKAVNVRYKTDIPLMSDTHIEEGVKGYEGVFGRDNYMGYPYIMYVREYATKIADKLIALDIATQRLKCPFYFIIDDIQLKDTMEDIKNRIVNNDDTIFRVKSKTFDTKEEPVKLENPTISPDIIRGIKESIIFDINMFLETIGINTNPNPDKSQVVLTTELNSNNVLIDLEQNIRLECRKEFCELAKDIMHIDISVESNIQEVMEHINDLKGGVENGNIGTDPGNSRQALQDTQSASK